MSNTDTARRGRTGHPHLLDMVGELPGKVFVTPLDLVELTQEIRRRLEA